ncbi:MAG: ATP-grasp domain-containing protein [Enterococcaceae bacterium]|nr:ATP-grasp domain-containing protein [Enterococcaceae bacterium]
MTVYIRDSEFPIEVSVNKYNVQVGFYLRGEEIVLYQSIHEIPALFKDDILIDYIYETRAILELMGIKIDETDYPTELEPFFGRKIRTGVLGEIVNNPDNWGSFIKPKQGSKTFTGRLVNGTQDLVGIGLPFDYPVWISEGIDFKREWRTFVLNREVLDVRPYKGDYHYQYDAKVIDQAISAWSNSPIAYSLDIGVTADHRTLVVEVNDGYALGNYGLSPALAAQFFEARWHELTAPFFASHEKLIIPEERWKDI